MSYYLDSEASCLHFFNGRNTSTTGGCTTDNSMNDDGPAHFILTVMQFMKSHYPGRWIRRNGPVYWPPLSPDITSADFFLGSHELEKSQHARRILEFGSSG
ncbi:hypothetical protein L798_14171 [Zootermopsis nevadensis]|uniref:Uncharacterized protein n=1 Tax=Zootermopsis nevadensis TaxID=136037 RepID=A0A067QQ04_ZOONE|nr:hypothetical protein L798_14171 [Zootermopsis nevadensis]